MWIILKRKTLLRGFCLTVGILLLGIAGYLLSAIPAAEASAPWSIQEIVYVIDPGHGGEDGGAVAEDNTVESGINLEISLRLRDILQFCGCHCCMTREEDISIYSPGCETLRQKKVSDLQNRAALVNAQEGAILVSIHQNSLPSSPGVRGAQVFYNQAEGAESMALTLQERLNQAANPEKERTACRISESIYLMNHVTAPAALIECGFLSHAEETQQLKTPEYQKTLAAAIAAGLLQSAGEGIP